MQDPGHRGDRDWLSRFLAGDREAFTPIYRAHSPAVFRFALHMTGDRIKAAEITQDVFVWLIQHGGSFDPSRGEMAAFLIGVARKFMLRQHKRDRRWVPLDESREAESREVFDNRANESGAGESLAGRLREAIALLPARYREVVVLCDLEGNSYEAAAAALECAVGTVRSRLHRARELLGRKLHSKKEYQRCAV